MIKWITIGLAVIGLGVGIYITATSGRELPNQPPASPPSTNPYDSAIAATGLVEAATRNVNVASPVPGLVMEVFAKVNDEVRQGDPLFRLDSRLLQADLRNAEAAVTVAEAELARLQAEPRPESVPVQRAAVSRAEADVELAQKIFELTRDSFRENAAARNEYERRTAAYESAKAHLAEEQAALAELEAGAWTKEIDVARAELGQAQAKVKALNIRIDRLTVRAPVAGTVLKRNVEPGEFVAPAAAGEAAMVVGDLSHLQVRAQVDEEDAPRLHNGAEAVARVRGRDRHRLKLSMLRIEPLAEPKRQLTGVHTELIDTRVVEAVFAVAEPREVRLYPGQIVDVFIKTDATSPEE